ncbi:MBG domain-containing protein [Cryomorphaceae bacterium 1068]|nr:MBG domain-containing protein [Cryomorphaceae bacterium 1068]
MKNLLTPRVWATLGLIVSVFSFSTLFAQAACEVSLNHEEGYTSTISSVVDNGDDSFTITLTVANDGCIGCKSINRYSIQAEPGTYSDITVEALDGDFSFFSLDLGPNIRCFQLDGFGLVGINGLGNGNEGSFSVTYTLSGGLQDQVVQPRAPFSPMPLLFTADDFQSVLDCNTPEDPIVPYYPPLEGGKSFDIIGSELTSLYNTFIATGTYISDDIFQIVDSNVIISIQTQPGMYLDALEILTTEEYGLMNNIGSQANNVLSGLYPISNLLLLNELPDLLISASPIYAPLNNAGLITSQGDSAMRSFRARDVFGLDGDGFKVGVLSDSYNTILDDPASDDVERGDLPGTLNPDYPQPVEVLADYPLGIRSDEGRAMLQIIHDVAPGASLAFRTGFIGPVDFAAGILALDDAGCDVIVDDITYISEPFFRDGIISQAVDEVNASGTAYFSAAGNFGTKSWEGTFSPTDAPADFEGAEAHNFAGDSEGNDIYQNITVDSGDYTLVLQWDDGTPEYDNTASDFDIYLVNDEGEILFGFNRVNTGGNPVEVLPFTVQADNTSANFLIVRESGTAPAFLKYIVYRGDVQINEYATPNASTIVGQPNAAGAISVGAVNYLNTPEYGGSPDIELFSSWGGTLVNGEDRLKPDFAGPNRVNTSVDLGSGSFQDGDIFFNFVGTSAAAPHAAALAALVLEAQQKFYDTSLLPEEVKNILQLSAIDMGTPGYDRASGAGFILADSALSQLANPAPFLTGLSYDTTLVPGVDTLEAIITGEYLKSGAVLYLNGSPVDAELSLMGSTEVTVTIPPTDTPFPLVQVFNQPKEGTNGQDGGLSNPISFVTKETILVNINDTLKPFGASFPEFTADYSLVTTDGINLPLDSTDLTEAEIARILSIELTTIANTLSNAGIWGIEPSANDPLNPESDAVAIDTLDVSLLERYDFVFSNGILTIDPIDLIITPRDTTYIYNDSIINLSFDYDFNADPESGLIISDEDSLVIVSAIQQLHTATIPERSAIVRGTALVNEFGEPLLNAALLTNHGFFVTTKVRQSRGTALVNGELIDPEIFFEAVAVQSGTEATARRSRGTALVNTFRLVRGTALVNTVDSTGAVVDSTLLSDPSSLTNSSGFLSPSFITENSNSETITIMGDSDISILSGDSTGTVETIPINLVTGTTVGTHFSLPGAFLTNNFNVQYGVGLVTILPDTLEITIDEEGLSQVYDGNPKSIDVTIMPDTIPIEITYNGETDLPINAGSYEVSINVLDTNYVGSVITTTLDIEQVSATVSTGIYVIDQGDPLPAFTAEFDGFVNDEDESVVTSLSFDVVDYIGLAGEYEVIPMAEAVNYSFESVSGTLFVNPAGPGTNVIQIKFLCYELLEEPLEGGYNLIATFGYRNLNDSPILIPAGTNNQLLGENFDDSNLPEVFQPGTNLFTVPFEASLNTTETPLTWALTSNRPEGVELRFASVTNIPCDDDAKSNSNNGMSVKDDFEDSKAASLFPNPSAGKVMISLDANYAGIESVEIYDLIGRKHSFDVTATSVHFMELNLDGFAEGIYIVRIKKTDGSFESLNLLIKQQ